MSSTVNMHFVQSTTRFTISEYVFWILLMIIGNASPLLFA